MEEKQDQNKKPDDRTEEIKEESQKQPEKIQEKSDEKPIEKKEEAQAEQPVEQKEESKEQEKSVEKPKEAKPEQKKEDKKKKDKHGEDFKYIVRIANTDVDGEKNIIYGLTTIKGIGIHMASLVADETGLDRFAKMGDLNDKQIEKIKEAIDNITENAPEWMLNHRKDYETGKNIHLVGPDIDMKLRDEINMLKKIRSYRGIRHERGLPVRGQRTRANNRKGLALGVSKKRTPGQ